ncbi:MAG TPA: hypothetical protein ENK18_15345 [Deltaproteobacteria bacterium]|nr:hypothetical protein [Deltaproteobacteria bacterium]
MAPAPPSLDDVLASLRLSPLDTFYVHPLADGQSQLVVLARTVRLAERCQLDPRLEQRRMCSSPRDHLSFVCNVQVTH